jgi:hypothetical protein
MHPALVGVERTGLSGDARDGAEATERRVGEAGGVGHGGWRGASGVERVRTIATGEGNKMETGDSREPTVGRWVTRSSEERIVRAVVGGCGSV